MLPKEPDAPKSSDEPLRGRICGKEVGRLLLLLGLLTFEELAVAWVVVLGSGVEVVAVEALWSCFKADTGVVLTRAEAVFEAMGIDFGVASMVNLKVKYADLPVPSLALNWRKTEQLQRNQEEREVCVLFSKESISLFAAKLRSFLIALYRLVL